MVANGVVIDQKTGEPKGATKKEEPKKSTKKDEKK